MKIKSKVVVTGYAVVPPTADQAAPNLTPDLGVKPQKLSRRLQRFACRAGPQAITASQLAFDMAGVKPEELGERLGLYTNQAGQQHSDIDDYQAGFAKYQKTESVIDYIWNGKHASPFLAIKGLSNNLIGLISILWSLRGDCAAFVRDQVGAASALDEALFNLQHGYIDSALVITAGTAADYFEIEMQRQTTSASKLNRHSHPDNECGAVALFLQRQQNEVLPVIAELSDMQHGYQSKTENADSPQVNFPNASGFDQILKDQYYFNQQEPRWGGIIYSVVQIIHLLIKQQLSPLMTIHSRNPDGFNASINLRLKEDVPV